MPKFSGLRLRFTILFQLKIGCQSLILRKHIPALLIICISLSFCAKQNEHKDAVAQVGNAVLTFQNLQNSFPREYKHLIKKEQYLDYIKRWMDEEILYQHALANKLDLNTDVADQIYALKKKIVVEYLLAREFSDVKYKPEEAALNQYFETHQDDFLRTEPEVRLLQLKVKDHKLAWAIHSKIKGGNFWGLIQKYSEGLKPESVRDIPFKKRGELNSCLAEPAFDIRVGGISSPHKCEDGVYIVRIAERKKTGTLKEYSDVKEEIHNILVQKWHQRNLSKKIDALKKEIYFSSNLELIP